MLVQSNPVEPPDSCVLAASKSRNRLPFQRTPPHRNSPPASHPRSIPSTHKQTNKTMSAADVQSPCCPPNSIGYLKADYDTKGKLAKAASGIEYYVTGEHSLLNYFFNY